MLLETHVLYEEARKVLGAKQLASILGVGVQHVYKLCADPISLDAPVRDDLERITRVTEALAARPHGKAALIMWRLYVEDHFARTVDHDEPSALTCAKVFEHVERISREYADVVHEAAKQERCPQEIARQGAELIAAVTTLIRCAAAESRT